MEVSWRDKSCPGAILTQFDPSEFSREGNGITRRGRAVFEIMDAASTLLSFVEISGSQTGKGERLEIIEKCISEAAVRKRLEPGFFLTELRRRLTVAEKGILRKVVVVGHLALSSTIGHIKARRIEGVNINIGTDVSRFTKEILRVTKYGPPFTSVPSSYMPVTFTMRARSDEDGFSRTRSAIFQLLGWWNHAVTYCRQTFHFGGLPGPIAQIVLAPVRTLHDPNGKAIDCVQYETDFVQYPAPFSNKAQWGRVQKAEAQIRAKLVGHHSREFLENVARAYYAACSCQMAETTFLTLWTLLELLTGTDKGDILIRRATFPMSQRYYAPCVWELRHLQFCRNCLVHRGDTRPDMNRIAYQLKFYVDVLLNWWVSESRTFQDKQEFLDLLDTPRDSTRLAQRIRVLRHALKHAERAGR